MRTEADETTYNLHVALRFELELALIEGRLEVDDLPAAWNERHARLLGVEVPDDAEGVLQDVHWAQGSFGYFPTYTLGNLMAAQFWQQIRADVPDVDDATRARRLRAAARLAARARPPCTAASSRQRELLRRATRQELSVEPFLAYLRDKLADAGSLAGLVRRGSRAPTPSRPTLGSSMRGRRHRHPGGPVGLVLVDGLLVQQHVGEPVEPVAVLGQQVA